MGVQAVLAKLSNVRRNGSGWTADCPCHESKSKKSLSVSEADGKVLIRCWAGCPTEDILKAIGLQWRDLFSDNGHRPETPPPKLQRPALDPLSWWASYCHVPADFLETLPLEADGGNLAFTFGPAAVRKLRPSGAKTFSWQPPGSPTPALWPLPGSTMPPTVWLLEGESDTTDARYIGLEAFALTHGAGTPLTPDQAAELKRRGVEKAIVCLDADRAGREGGAKLAAVLQDARILPVVVDLADARLVDPLLGQKDLRDFWRATADREAARAMLEAAALEVAKKPAINGQPPNLPPIGTSVVGEVCAADLKARPHQEIEYLPFLDRPGYVPRGWSILLAAYPKTGKTELMARLCGSWATEGESILYVTEEPAVIWQHRLANLPGAWERVRLLFGLGMEPGAILERIKAGQETIVVIDTVRSVVGLEDETDNSEVARVLGPYVAAAREGGKTLILLHHVRKGGGEHGEGITGGHAFLGIVDVALELLREPNLGDRRRRVRGWGRLMPIEEVVYALEDDGTMAVLGSPKAVELGAVKERLLAILNGDWRTRKELLEELGEPKPAMEQLRLALNALVAEGAAERDPATDKPGATYRYRLAQPNLPPAGYMVVGEVVDNKPNLARDDSMVRGEVANPESADQPNLQTEVPMVGGLVGGEVAATGPPRDAQDATVTPTEGGDTGCLADF